MIEDEQYVRESLGILLEEDGYEVSFAENGREALARLHAELRPDIIVLDLKMPLMNGWEFREAQKNDPRLALIPVLALSADESARASAISADGYLLKPVGSKVLLDSIASILFRNKQRAAAQLDQTQRLLSLERLAARVGHEINNPLAFVMMNLGEMLDTLTASSRPLETASGVPVLPEVELAAIEAHVKEVVEMLEACQLGLRRIRETASNLQSLVSGSAERDRLPLDLHALIDQSLSTVWNQIRHRARLVKAFGKVPAIQGRSTALRQLFRTMLINAVQAIPEGDANRHEIRVSTSTEEGDDGAEVVVEFRDSGEGMTPETMSQVFEPYFTTRSVGIGTGLGLSLSRQTVTDHGGRMTVESEPGKGSVFRIFLPVGRPTAASA